MSAFNKFNCFAGDLGLKIHNLNTDQLKVYLSNVAPSVANTVYGAPADLATGGGYTAGGIALANSFTGSAGLWTLASSANLLWTATSGFGPFRYAVLYNNTAPAKNLIGWWDNGASVSVGALGTFGVNFGSAILTIQ